MPAIVRFAVLTLSMIFYIFTAAYSQELAPFQPDGTLITCKPSPIYEKPAQKVARQSDAGQQVEVRGFTFGEDAKEYYEVEYATGRGLEKANGFIAIDDASHFCGYGARRADTLYRFRAPPNTCHLIAASRRSLQDVNEFATEYAEYLPSMAVYRTADDWYAISMGLVSLQSAQGIMSGSDRLPKDAYCSQGDGYIGILERIGSEFQETSVDTSISQAERAAEAEKLHQIAQQSGDSARMKRACDLGAVDACRLYADTLSSPPPDESTHYYLLGCMRGDISSCKDVINFTDNTLENAQFRSLDVGSTDHLPLVSPELAKLGCDAGVAVSCILLYRPVEQYGVKNITEYSIASAAATRACRNWGAWSCGDMYEIIATAPADYSIGIDTKYGLAKMGIDHCEQGAGNTNTSSCDATYRRFASFLSYRDQKPVTERTALRVDTAKAFIEKGCNAGDWVACAVMSEARKDWTAEQRSAATSKAVSFCSERQAAGEECDELKYRIDPRLPESRPVILEKYETYANECRTNREDDGVQACSSALSSYASMDPNAEMNELEALLTDTCNKDQITGCKSLALFYSPYSLQLVNLDEFKGRNQPEKYLAALKTGCTSDDRAGQTCEDYADAIAKKNDISQALDLYRDNCKLLMLNVEKPLDDAYACYEAAKYALDQKTAYDDALQQAKFACNSSDMGISPYACKLVGNIYAQGLGVPVDEAEAMNSYQSACFHPLVGTTDGEGCLRYGEMLIKNRERFGDDWFAENIRFLPPEEVASNEAIMSNLSEASRAFDLGCLDGIDQACKANAKLLEDWSNGAYPDLRHQCSIRDDAGNLRSSKPCKAFDFYQAAPDAPRDTRQTTLRVYVWPDGERTVTSSFDGEWYLNSIRTEPAAENGDTICQRNPISTRTFCAEMPGRSEETPTP